MKTLLTKVSKVFSFFFTDLLHSPLTTRQFLEDVLMVFMHKTGPEFGTLRNWTVEFSRLWLASDPPLPSRNGVLLNGIFPLKTMSLWFFFHVNSGYILNNNKKKCQEIVPNVPSTKEYIESIRINFIVL